MYNLKVAIFTLFILVGNIKASESNQKRINDIRNEIEVIERAIDNIPDMAITRSFCEKYNYLDQSQMRDLYEQTLKDDYANRLNNLSEELKKLEEE